MSELDHPPGTSLLQIQGLHSTMNYLLPSIPLELEIRHTTYQQSKRERETMIVSVMRLEECLLHVDEIVHVRNGRATNDCITRAARNSRNQETFDTPASNRQRLFLRACFSTRQSPRILALSTQISLILVADPKLVPRIQALLLKNGNDFNGVIVHRCS